MLQGNLGSFLIGEHLKASYKLGIPLRDLQRTSHSLYSYKLRNVEGVENIAHLLTHVAGEWYSSFSFSKPFIQVRVMVNPESIPGTRGVR